MKWYEINALLKYAHYGYKDGWEQARLIAYMIAQTNSKKKLSFEDIVKFNWDNDSETEQTTVITKNDIERLNKKAAAYLNNLKT